MSLRSETLRDSPYLSIVAPARNDDHGGNLSRRMQLFINGVLEQSRRHQLDCELVLVEWNPPTDRPRLAEAFSWPVEGSPCRVRIIEVPPEVHRTFENSDRIPLFQFIAKNAGIRRAKGDFILATNIDLLFSDELVAFIAAEELRSDSYYRVNRHDVPADLPEEASIDELLAFCQEQIMRSFYRDGTYSRASRSFHRIYPSYPGMLGKLAVLIDRMFAELKLASQSRYEDNAARKVWRLGRIPRLLSTSRPYNELLKNALKYLRSPSRARLHTNASGDFTLMARENWGRLRGYPELPLHGMHIDSVLCYMAYFLPLREVVLPDSMRIYHIEHLHGWTPEAAMHPDYDLRLRELGIPRMSHDELNEIAIQLEKGERSVISNEPDWGLGSSPLPETII